jgi:type VI secretion system protein ImpM
MSLLQTPTPTSQPLEVGFYGKLPSHGDFLRRRVSDAFVGVWDAWLQECVAESRSALGDGWLDVYLTSPAWRFVCAAGACGPAPVAGIMVPSVDRVGRYFPLTLVAELPASVGLVAAATEAAPFFESAERVVVEALSAERLDFESFDRQVSHLREELQGLGRTPRVTLEPGAAAVLDGAAPVRWQMPIGSAPQLGGAFQEVLARRLMSIYDPLVLWWTEGSSIIEPSCLVGRGLPSPGAFVALLDGAWVARDWRAVAAVLDAQPAPEPLVEDMAPPRFRSAAATDVGRHRKVNQDSFLERADVGIWVVADGVGGHSHGEVASRMVCDAIADLVPEASFADVIDSAGRRLVQVNDYLVRAARRAPDAGRAGSTVVVLLARGSRCAVLWAGDSRVYRFRGGRLTQITQDHSVAESGEPGSESSTAITRAVGGDDTLELDLYRDRVRVGDRFLLCSDGLTREVPEAQIRVWMEHQDIRQAVDGLIKAALEAGAHDNVTAVIVEAYTQ